MYLTVCTDFVFAGRVEFSFFGLFYVFQAWKINGLVGGGPFVCLLFFFFSGAKGHRIAVHLAPPRVRIPPEGETLWCCMSVIVMSMVMALIWLMLMMVMVDCDDGHGDDGHDGHGDDGVHDGVDDGDGEDDYDVIKLACFVSIHVWSAPVYKGMLHVWYVRKYYRLCIPSRVYHLQTKQYQDKYPWYFVCVLVRTLRK